MKIWFAILIWALTTGISSAEDLPVVELKTPHGITFIFLRSDVQNTVAVSLAFKGGIASDPPEKSATAFAVSGMLMEGSGGKSASEIYESLQDVGAQFNVSPNADEIYADLSAPAKGILGAARLAHDILTKPDFPEKKFLQSRESFARRLEEIAAYPESAVQDAFTSAVIGPHPYMAAFSPKAASVRMLQISDLKPWVARHFSTRGIMVAVVGDLEPLAAAAIVDTLLDGLPATSDLPDTPPISLKTPPAQPIAISAKTGEQAVIAFGSVAATRVTVEQWFSLDLLSRIFAGDQKSRLFKDIREATGATYGLQPSWNIYAQGLVNLVSGRIAKSNAEKTLTLIEKSWDNFRMTGPTPDEVDNAKAVALQNLSDVRRSHAAMAGYLRDNLTGRLTTAQIVKIPSFIQNLDLNDKATLAQFFPENPIIVVAQ